MAQDYYSILGVPRDASAQDIKKAFRAIARECHPDVAGADPRAEERFKSARKAYETLMDPVTRARYDRRGQRRAAPRGSFFDAFYRSTGGSSPSGRAKHGAAGAHAAGGHASSRNADKDPANDLDLDDLFNDFGDFGFGRRRDGAREARTGPRPEPPPESKPIQGSDVHLDLQVPARTARDGGSVTVVYYRMQRADAWRPGSSDPGVVRVQDIADIRVIPGTRDGEVLRERGLGDAGPHGGPMAIWWRGCAWSGRRRRPSRLRRRSRSGHAPGPGRTPRRARGASACSTSAWWRRCSAGGSIFRRLGGRCG